MIGIEIAGLTVALDVQDAELASQLAARYGAFLAEPASPLLTLRVAVNADGDFAVPRNGEWPVEIAVSGDGLSYRSLYDSGWFDLATARGSVDVRQRMDLENFLRVLYAHLCVRNQALLLHSAGVLRDERGYILFGPSGSGKSTTAHLSLDEGMTVLGDDMVIVRWHAGGFRACAVPFRGSNSRAPQVNTHAPLAGAFALVRSDHHEQVTLSGSEAVARLVRCVPYIMSDHVTGAQAVATCQRLARSVPVADLLFRRDAQFWRIIGESTGAVPNPA